MIDNRPILALCALAFAGLSGPLANAEGAFRVGLQAGLPQWEEEVGVQIPDQPPTLVEPDAAAAVGAVGQYMVRANPDAERSFYIGFEASALAEGVSHSQDVVVLGIPVNAVADIAWSTDLLWLGGYDFGAYSVYVGAGASAVSTELTVSAFGLTGNASKTHLGWKLAPGVEIDIGPSQSVLIRASYGVYRSETYSDPSVTGLVSLSVEPKVFDLRVAWVYTIDTASLFGLGRSR